MLFLTIHFVTVPTLVSGILSAVGAAIITSIIAWCVMKRAQRKTVQDDRDKEVSHELDPVIYDIPDIKQHNNQCLSTQGNVAYGGKVPLKQNNNTYEEIK